MVNVPLFHSTSWMFSFLENEYIMLQAGSPRQEIYRTVMQTTGFGHTSIEILIFCGILCGILCNSFWMIHCNWSYKDLMCLKWSEAIGNQAVMQ